MAKRAKRDEGHRIREESHAESAGTVSGPVVPQDLAMMAWFLAPESMGNLRRQLVDGKAGQFEPRLYTFAYSGPVESEADRRSLRFITTAQWEAEQAGHPLPEQPDHAALGDPDADSRETTNARGERSKGPSGYRINWDKMVLELRRRARALVEDPEYRESLRRRIADGKAPKMMALLLQWPERKSRDPYEKRRGKPQVTVVTPYPVVGRHAHDPLAGREKAMRAAQQADEALQARVGEEVGFKQAAAAPPEDPPDPDVLVRGEDDHPAQSLIGQIQPGCPAGRRRRSANSKTAERIERARPGLARRLIESNSSGHKPRVGAAAPCWISAIGWRPTAARTL